MSFIISNKQNITMTNKISHIHTAYSSVKSHTNVRRPHSECTNIIQGYRGFQFSKSQVYGPIFSRGAEPSLPQKIFDSDRKKNCYAKLAKLLCPTHLTQ